MKIHTPERVYSTHFMTAGHSWTYPILFICDQNIPLESVRKEIIVKKEGNELMQN